MAYPSAATGIVPTVQENSRTQQDADSPREIRIRSAMLPCMFCPTDNAGGVGANDIHTAEHPDKPPWLVAPDNGNLPHIA